VLAKLSEVLFVETLRRYINSLPADQQAGSPVHVTQSSAKLSLCCTRNRQIHGPFSDLARRIGLSRTRLAERFRHFLGVSPMAYLAQWRLKLGAEILQSSGDSVAQVAATVGYGSEAHSTARSSGSLLVLRRNFVASERPHRPSFESFFEIGIRSSHN